MNIFIIIINIILCIITSNYMHAFQQEEMGQQGQLPGPFNYFVENELVNFDGQQQLNNIDSITNFENDEKEYKKHDYEQDDLDDMVDE